MFTREEAIKNYVENLTGWDIYQIVCALNSWNGAFEDYQWYDMYELDCILDGSTPSKILSMVGADFNINDDYFRFDGCGNLESAYDCQIEKEMESIEDEIIDYLQGETDGYTEDDVLDAIIDADEVAMFDEETFEQVDAE